VLSDGAGNIRNYFNDVGTAFFDCVDTPDGTNRRGFSVVYNTGISDTTKIQIACTTTSTRALAEFNNSNGNVGSISVSASLTSYNVSSDRRLKENITPLTTGLSSVLSLKPSQYNYKADPTTSIQGFIADELEKVVPHAVTGEANAVDKDGKPVYQGVDASFLIPFLVSAIQELNEKITALENK
jgi:hypothetical protein